MPNHASRLACMAALTLLGAPSAAYSEEHQIIDMHLHALPADYAGPPPRQICRGVISFLPMPQEGPGSVADLFECEEPMLSAETDEELMRLSLAQMERLNIVGVASGPQAVVDRWHEAAPERVIPGLLMRSRQVPSVDEVRQLVKSGKLAVLGEVALQYEGLPPGDPFLEPYWDLAEELDLPVALHMGLGPPGAHYVGQTSYRASLSNPLHLEPVLIRHPKMRIYVMHAGWPMLDEMIALMYSHPQVYVDVGIIDWGIPRAEFHHYLKRLIDAGMGKRVLFGSDQMIWPQAIPLGIEAVEAAPFLSESQKRDIFFNNALRFLRLDADKLP